ncbi:MAG: DNA mismatch repair endonuclease MutL [Firmicutes bacterium]|nr:DNA mismatch repair endonuclease MutL [Bacillota bacterium]
MNKIILLDELTAGQIAAGEVVERPVSVVKELVENSLDAGADQITIEIIEGGNSGITVYDNGHGISQEEVSLAFYRHATSKITSVNDLYSLSTLGFRGEALSSIAAVSRVVLKTKPPSEKVGQRIEVKGSEVISLQAVGCSSGTSVKVSDLFYNTPARRKHLKSKGTEAGLVTGMVQNIALLRPEIRFLFKHNDKTVFHTPGSGRLIDSISAIYGVKTAREMVEVNATKGSITLAGMISKPSINRATRQYISVAVNGRYVRNQLINQAIDEAYGGLVLTGRHPMAVLKLSLGQGQVDANIHPAKMEVRFDRETEVISFIKEVIRNQLKKEILIPTYEQRGAAKRQHEQWNESKSGTVWTEKYMDGVLPVQKHFESKNKQQNENILSEFNVKTPAKKLQSDVFRDSINDNSKTNTREASASPYDINARIGNAKVQNSEPQTGFPFLHVIGQLAPTYIIAADPDGLYILDQHAAHERIIFENLLAMMDSEQKETQMLLTPVSLELDYKSRVLLQENLWDIRNLGFEVEEFGADTYVLRGVPAHLSTFKGEHDLTDLLEEISDLKKDKDFYLAFTIRLACRTAIKSGEVLSLSAMDALVQQLSCTNEPYTCPHGRPTLVKLTQQELTQMFKRTN